MGPITTAAPMVTYATAAPVTTVAAPAVIEAGPRNLLAMGNVVSERVITIEELAQLGRYDAAEPVTVQAPVVAPPVVYQTVATPAITETIVAPQVYQTVAAPAITETIVA